MLVHLVLLTVLPHSQYDFQSLPVEKKEGSDQVLGPGALNWKNQKPVVCPGSGEKESVSWSSGGGRGTLKMRSLRMSTVI